MSKSLSSRTWLERQAQDEYVVRAKRAGYRCRAVYKIIEIQQKMGLVQPGMCVVDLGAAPGGWAQKLVDYVGNKGQVVAVDRLSMTPLTGVHFIQGDFTQPDIMSKLLEQCTDPSGIDCVVSDMAPNMSGHKATDQLKAMGLIEVATQFALAHLKPGGNFLCKVFHCGGFEALLREIRGQFERVKVYKPNASRAASSEAYLVAKRRKNLETDVIV